METTKENMETLEESPPPPPPLSGVETDDPLHHSVTGLRELRSQLHHAADYCEAAFLKAAGKKLVMENTKSYICQSVVTVIDHLGTASYNLEHQLSTTVEIGETEQRINCLRQRLLTWDQYALSLELSTMQWSTEFPRHHLHYVSPLVYGVENSKNVRRPSDRVHTFAHRDDAPDLKDALPMAIGQSTSDSGVDGTELDAAAPVFERALMLPKPLDKSFGFNMESACTPRSGSQRKKSVHGSNILSLLLKSKRK